jgi:hypothetical protein
MVSIDVVFRHHFRCQKALAEAAVGTSTDYDFIRKDCFQVKSNLLTVDNLVFHFKLQFLIKSN